MSFEFNGNILYREQINLSNVKEVYEFCEENSDQVSLSFEVFRKATIKSVNFNPELSVIIRDFNKKIIGFFMVIFRPSFIFGKKRKVAVLKFFIISHKWRIQGLGTKIYQYLAHLIKKSKEKVFWMKFEVMASQPDYLFPGISPQLTPALLFLKSIGFKKYDERLYLKVDLNKKSILKPPKDLNGFKVSRATPNEKEDLRKLNFMPWRYRIISWPDEIALSYENSPISTFIAKKADDNRVIGFATHSVGFPGSFGPMGVMKKYRKVGLGTLLLKWCAWDLKDFNINYMIIRWTGKGVLSFYSKALGAKVSDIFWALKKRI
ncbi:MAG: GNAT family N-acetyltransferase [Candidatus Lokiarchaeota archaeon]